MFGPPPFIRRLLSSIAFVDSDEAYARSVTIPNNVQAGDILVFATRAVQQANFSPVTPSGWTNFQRYGDNVSTSGYFCLQEVAYKIADGTEGNTVVAGTTGDDEEFAVVAIFRPNVPATAINPVDSGGGDTNTNPAPVTVDADNGSPPMIVLGTYGSLATVSPRTMSPSKDGEDGRNQLDGGGFWLAWKIFNSNATPVEVSVDMDDEGNLNCLAAGYLSIL